MKAMTSTATVCERLAAGHDHRVCMIIVNG